VPADATTTTTTEIGRPDAERPAPDRPGRERRDEPGRPAPGIGASGELSGWLGWLGAAAIAALAIVEIAQALVAPGRAPTEADWRAAAAQVRAGFRTGDLIVAAPDWADPVLRLHLGDLLPIPVAARMDDARYGRIWEIGQRGAHVVEPGASAGAEVGSGAAPGRVALEARFGALTVRRIERPAAAVTFDFLERWREGTVGSRGPGGTLAPCAWTTDRFACGDGTTVHRELVEVDTRIRRALLAPPPAGAESLVITFEAVPLGRTLAVAAGLHDVWARKLGAGTVRFQVFVGATRVHDVEIGNRSGWAVHEIDTREVGAPGAGAGAGPGHTATVRFEISSARPQFRHFAFAAEARN
jgi:hypothetical protein